MQHIESSILYLHCVLYKTDAVFVDFHVLISIHFKQYSFEIVIMKTDFMFFIVLLLAISAKISWSKYILIEIVEDGTGKFDFRDFSKLIGT